MISEVPSPTVLVAHIRERCTAAFDLPLSFPFFSLDYQDGEDADAALLRLFTAEREAQIGVFESVTTDSVIDALING